MPLRKFRVAAFSRWADERDNDLASLPICFFFFFASSEDLFSSFKVYKSKYNMVLKISNHKSKK